MEKKMVVAWFVAVVAVMVVNESTLLGEANVDFDYLKLAQHWTPTVCMGKKKCKVKAVEDFLIHGLWPDRKEGRTPLNCGTQAYEPIVDKNLLEKLNSVWINLVDGPAKNAVLWQHEWEKHGCCAYEKLTQVQYFEKGVEMNKKYDLISSLRKNKILPGDGLHKISDIKKAIQSITKKDFYVLCLKQNNQQYVYEIQVCFDQLGNEVIDCPANRGPQCTGEAYLPKATSYHQLLHSPE